MVNEIIPNQNLDSLIESYKTDDNNFAKYEPGVFRKAFWAIGEIFGSKYLNSKCLDSKKKYLQECRESEDRLAKEYEKRQKQAEKDKEKQNKQELVDIVNELSSKLRKLESQSDKITKICLETEDEEKRLQLKLNSDYELDLTKLGHESPFYVSTEEIPNYIRKLRDFRIELRVNSSSDFITSLVNKIKDEIEEISTQEIISAYLKQSTKILDELEKEQRERVKAKIKLESLPLEREAAERQEESINEALLQLTKRKAVLDRSLTLVELGIEAPETVLEAMELADKGYRKLENLEQECRIKQIQLAQALLELKSEPPKQLEVLTEDRDIIEASAQEIHYLTRERQ